jgi:hypothetical protein
MTAGRDWHNKTGGKKYENEVNRVRGYGITG